MNWEIHNRALLLIEDMCDIQSNFEGEEILLSRISMTLTDRYPFWVWKISIADTFWICHDYKRITRLIHERLWYESGKSMSFRWCLIIKQTMLCIIRCSTEKCSVLKNQWNTWWLRKIKFSKWKSISSEVAKNSRLQHLLKSNMQKARKT